MTTFPSHSWERWYQIVRRFGRFGQPNTVTADMITSEGEAGVLANLQRKSEQAGRAFAQLVEVMNAELRLEREPMKGKPEVIPSWL